jgi:hypothetical protein
LSDLDLSRVITYTDDLHVMADGVFWNVIEAWAKEFRAPSEFTFEMFVASALDHIADGDYEKVRINGTVYEEADLERIYESQTGKKLAPKNV